MVDWSLELVQRGGEGQLGGVLRLLQVDNCLPLPSDYWNLDEIVRKRAVRATLAEWHGRFPNTQAVTRRTVNRTLERQGRKGSVAFE